MPFGKSQRHKLLDAPMKLLDSIEAKISKLQALKEWLAPFNDGLSEIPKLEPPVLFHEWLDFDNLTHSQAVRVMMILGGKKWNKNPNPSNRTFDYISAEPINGVKVRLWSAEAPPSCRLVEEEIDVPETVVPAHKEKRVKMVCAPEPETAEPSAQVTA